MIIFFVRKFNDVDNMTPIIYKMAESKREEVVVLSLNPGYPLEQDYHFKFLREGYGLRVDYVYNYCVPTLLHRFFATLMCGPLSKLPRLRAKGFISSLLLGGNTSAAAKEKPFQNPGDYIVWAASRLYNKYFHRRIYGRVLKPRVFNQRWAKKMLLKAKPSLLVFDPVKREQWVSGAILDAAKELNIPTVSVPHGMIWYTNDLFSDTLVKRGKLPDYGRKNSLFDFFVVKCQRYKEYLVRAGMSPEKIIVLGSARYCEEWSKLHYKLTGASGSVAGIPSNGRLKVVFMDFPAVYRINVDAVEDTIYKLSNLDFIQLLIKPHTRSNRMSTDKLGHAARVVSEIPSINLCMWADVIMGTSSSILLEAYLQDKVLLYPKYFHQNTMLFEEFNACWKVSNYQELEEALRTLSKNPTYKPYSKEDVERVLTEVVYGGTKGRDVLSGYVDFLLKVKERRLLPMSPAAPLGVR